jgi:hypothetical protein
MKWQLRYWKLLLVLWILPQQGLAFDVPDLPEASRGPVSGKTAPSVGSDVKILSHQGQWTSLLGTGGSSEPLFLISGQLENLAKKPLTYVKLQCELLGQDDVTVYRDYVYNRKAEALRDEDYENGKKTLADMQIEAINVGATESFRFIFFKSDVPEFLSYRIRVMETH